MNNLKLFADRISHPSRFCIQFLKMNQIPFEEIKVSLLFGENANHPELPFKQIPVLQLSVENDQRCQVPMTIVQSTTILKYLSDKAGPTQVEDKWYPKNLEARAHVDEFVDFWHSSMNSVNLVCIICKNLEKKIKVVPQSHFVASSHKLILVKTLFATLKRNLILLVMPLLLLFTIL